ncbi:hypothetical protein [Nocardia wallacei]|uniref:hypothetical protein n=1 Tax=Nocardia wallacei TaxID=480035 RepID=UPI00245569FE|nr:hypothetical protein [Nocardia wallacei]
MRNPWRWHTTFNSLRAVWESQRAARALPQPPAVWREEQWLCTPMFGAGILGGLMFRNFDVAVMAALGLMPLFGDIKWHRWYRYLYTEHQQRQLFSLLPADLPHREDPAPDKESDER